MAALLRNRKLTAALCETLIEKVASVAEGISPRAFYATMAFERLFEHPAAPIALLQALLIRKSCPKYLRARTAAPHARRDVLECLLSDESERVRRRATRVLLSRIRAVDPVVEHANEGS